MYTSYAIHEGNYLFVKDVHVFIILNYTVLPGPVAVCMSVSPAVDLNVAPSSSLQAHCLFIYATTSAPSYISLFTLRSCT